MTEDRADSVLAPPRAEPMAHPHRTTFDQEMAAIKDSVLRMASLVEGQIRAAMAALVRHDADAALQVIHDDAGINEVMRAVTSQVTAVIATQAPVARDLRFLLTLDHVAYELERMGDHAGSVAKQARKMASQPPLKQYVDLPELGETVARQVRGIIRALVDVDQATAREVAAGDDDVDALYHRIFDDVLELMRAHPDNVDRGTRILFAAHYLERIGDRVTNIAEDIVFLASGDVEDLNP
ncbi:MAG TPA: phosphate signaling complex protein PhoU [Candidatus Limnocylindrales bacterium]|nr:phosphate signaling complex protein PhoU [Candidatus Limnocylindrales bacterium]